MKSPRSLASALAAGFALALCLLLAACAVAPTSAPVPEPAPVVTPIPKKPPRIGLALGGGAARGFAHIGVIQMLEEAGIRPGLVVGTSAGSVVAALYASGKSGAQLQQVAEAMDRRAAALSRRGSQMALSALLH